MPSCSSSNLWVSCAKGIEALYRPRTIQSQATLNAGGQHDWHNFMPGDATQFGESNIVFGHSVGDC